MCCVLIEEPLSRENSLALEICNADPHHSPKKKSCVDVSVLSISWPSHPALFAILAGTCHVPCAGRAALLSNSNWSGNPPSATTSRRWSSTRVATSFLSALLASGLALPCQTTRRLMRATGPFAPTAQNRSDYLRRMAGICPIIESSSRVRALMKMAMTTTSASTRMLVPTLLRSALPASTRAKAGLSEDSLFLKERATTSINTSVHHSAAKPQQPSLIPIRTASYRLFCHRERPLPSGQVHACTRLMLQRRSAVAPSHSCSPRHRTTAERTSLVRDIHLDSKQAQPLAPLAKKAVPRQVAPNLQPKDV